MKPTTKRVLLGGLAVAAGGIVAWRVGTAAMTTHRWSSNFERGQQLLEEGNIVEAAAALEAAQQAMRNLGPQHASFDETRMRLAEAYEASGRFDDAYPLYLENLMRVRATAGPDSAEVASSLFELGRVRRNQGQNEAAVGLFRQAMVAWQEVHGNEHPDLIPTLTLLGLALRDTGQVAEAGQYLEWAIGLQRRDTGSNSPQVAGIESAYAEVLESLNQKELAAQFRAHAESITATPPAASSQTAPAASTPAPSREN